jgi:hypothetical protein
MWQLRWGFVPHASVSSINEDVPAYLRGLGLPLAIVQLINQYDDRRLVIKQYRSVFCNPARIETNYWTNEYTARCFYVTEELMQSFPSAPHKPKVWIQRMFCLAQEAHLALPKFTNVSASYVTYQSQFQSRPYNSYSTLPHRATRTMEWNLVLR